MPHHTESPGENTDHEAQLRDVLADARKMAAENKHLKAALEEAIALLWIGWFEMNAIRARSGVPLDFDGRPQAIVEGYWDEAVEKMAEFLSRYDADKPWPYQHFKLEWSDAAAGSV